MTEPARASGPKKFVVAATKDIPIGERLIVEVAGREIGIYNVEGEFFALLNRCPHLGGPLCKGQVVNEITSTGPGDFQIHPDRTYVTCPWHNWEFDVRTGQSYWNPNGLRARPFPLKIENGSDLAGAVESGGVERIPGPFMAETIPITVEDDYLVVAVRAEPRPQPQAEVNA